jgi:BirA family biotin operon repressor/biotin-[acetyl-CoA-carboxylase] ligase
MGDSMNGGGLVLPASTGMWTAIEVVASTGSTNADLLARAVAEPGLPEGQVLVAEEQTAGRGRLGRTWTSVPGASLTFSLLLRPAAVPQGRRGWLPLLTGVAVATAVRLVTAGPAGGGSAVEAVLKWPNDVLAGDRKLAGILAEQSPDGSAVVVGVGLNVATPAEDLPLSPAGLPATSLLAEGASVSRQTLLLEVLRQFERRYAAFRLDPDPARTGLLAEYRGLCGTLGRRVRVELPVGRTVTGTATDIDLEGRLLVTESPAVTPTPISAGDVVHVRLPAAARGENKRSWIDSAAMASFPIQELSRGGPTMSLWPMTARWR